MKIKKLLHNRTQTKNEKGIVEVVKFNYGQTKIGPSTQVVPIDKLNEMGKFNLEDFLLKKTILKDLKQHLKKLLLMEDGKITLKKFKGKFKDLIAMLLLAQ